MGRKDAAAEHPVASRAHRGLWALVALTVIALASIALLLPDASKERGTVTAFVGEYCVDCHNTTDFDGGFAFNAIAFSSFRAFPRCCISDEDRHVQEFP